VAGLARAEWLRPWWFRAALLLLAVGTVVAVGIADWPWWAAMASAALLGEVVASALYVTTPAVFGRVIGVMAGATAVLALLADGAWKWCAAGPFAVAVALGWIRWSGTRQIDRVTPDRTFVPFLFDEGDRLVDTLDAVWGSTRPGGRRHGLRAAHSHGSVVHGRWERDASCDPAPDGVELFREREGTVVARFSNFRGEIDRDDQRRTVHGLALELRAPGKGSFTMVLVDIRRFPVATREDFIAFTNLLGATGFHRLWGFANLVFTGRTTLVAALRTMPLRRAYSYADRTYHGLNAFHCSLDGNEVPVRYLVSPIAPPAGPPIPPAAVAVPQTRLDGELQARLRAGVPVSFQVRLVVGQRWNGKNLSPDRVRDPTRSWGRRTKRLLCTVTLNRYVPTDKTDRLLFQPFNVPDGIRPSDDEVLSARRTAYATSFMRRCPFDEVQP
jgi:catalase